MTPNFGLSIRLVGNGVAHDTCCRGMKREVVTSVTHGTSELSLSQYNECTFFMNRQETITGEDAHIIMGDLT